MAYTCKGTDYLYNSYIEIEHHNLPVVYNLAYDIFGTSFERKDVINFPNTYLIFFNSDISMYELFLDFLKESKIPFSGNHEIREVIFNVRSKGEEV